MQPGSTFQKLEAVGSCQVGTVWSAVDVHGLAVTVAMLDETVATDKRWRDAFASTAQSMVGGSGGPRFLYADFSAAAPWVACEGPGAEQIFIALGMDYKPTASPDSAGQASAAGADQVSPASPAPASADSADSVSPASPAGGTDSSGQADTPAATADRPVTESPTTAIPRVAHPPIPAFAPPVSAAPPPGSATTAAVPGVPQSPAVGPQPPTFDPPPPVSGAGPGGGWSSEQAGSVPEMSYTYQPRFSSIEPSDLGARRSRSGLWIGVAVVVVLALAVTAGVYAWPSGGGEAPEAAGSSSPAPLPPPPTNPPVSPGVEPPKPGSWPTQWPRFSPDDQLRTYSDLEGIDFTLKIPADWECTLGIHAEGYVRYRCGTTPGAEPNLGGDIIVRDCPQPCDAARQAQMRDAEEAFGAQWHVAGPSAVWGENLFDSDIGRRHGLTVIAYYRHDGAGEVDRQLVMRLSAPADQAPTLRKVANYLRDTLIF